MVPLVAANLPRLYTPSIEEGKVKDAHDVLSALALSVILMTSLALSIFFGVSVSASINVPLLVYGSIGIVSLILLTAQVSKTSKESWIRTMARVISFLAAPIIRNNLFIEARGRFETVENLRAVAEAAINRCPAARIVSYQAQDGVRLGGIWHFVGTDRPTVILFHGNGYRVDREVGRPWWNYYVARGFNIFLPEYRGYGMSEGEAGEELGAYYDAEAAKDFVISQGIEEKNIIAHGISLGGLYAAAIGRYVRAVILNHTFTHFPAIANHIVGERFTSFVNNVCQCTFPFKEERGLRTDLFDNVAKVRGMEADLLVIRGEEDALMKYEFGEELIQARYEDGATQHKRLLTFPGGHSDFIHWVGLFSRQVDQFFNECDFIIPGFKNLAQH